MPKATYRILSYDSADDPGRDGKWTMRAKGLTLWQLRGPIRELRAACYSEVSTLIEREDFLPGPPLTIKPINHGS